MHRYQILAVVGWIILATMSQAAKYNRVVDLGQAAPPWSKLAAVDGHTYTIDSFRGADAIVIVFTCNLCPVANAYVPRLKQLAEDFASRSVKIIAINVNADETLEQMKDHAGQHEFNFPYLYDKKQDTARAYGATCTPHVFLLNKERKIAYMGAIDDHWIDASEVKRLYLREAIEDLLDGNQPQVGEVRPVGCAIHWNR